MHAREQIRRAAATLIDNASITGSPRVERDRVRALPVEAAPAILISTGSDNPIDTDTTFGGCAIYTRELELSVAAVAKERSPANVSDATALDEVDQILSDCQKAIAADPTLGVNVHGLRTSTFEPIEIDDGELDTIKGIQLWIVTYRVSEDDPETLL